MNLVTKTKNLNYDDVTDIWLKNKTKYTNIKNAKSVVINKKRYFVNEINKINHTNNEVHIAKLLVKTFGGKLEYLPVIGEEDGIQCGDYFFKNEIWDLKEIGKNVISEKRAVDNVLKRAKRQSSNFVLDITNCNLDRIKILNQIKKIYKNKCRDWIDKIIVFDNNKLLKVYVRKK